MGMPIRFCMSSESSRVVVVISFPNPPVVVQIGAVSFERLPKCSLHPPHPHHQRYSVVLINSCYDLCCCYSHSSSFYSSAIPSLRYRSRPRTFRCSYNSRVASLCFSRVIPRRRNIPARVCLAKSRRNCSFACEWGCLFAFACRLNHQE